MKNAFPGYYPPSEEQLREMWQTAIFAFDANVFLNIYKYTSATRESLFSVLDDLKDRIWIPHQAALEYTKNRSNVIESQVKSFEKLNVLLDEMYDRLSKQLDGFRRHFSIKVDPILDSVQSGITQARESLEADKASHPDLSTIDPVNERITGLIKDKIGPEFDDQRLGQIYIEAQQRFKNKRPPGFKDEKSDKEYPNQYNDVVLWFQVIEFAKTHGRPIILITDEEQADWWDKNKKDGDSPRAELINEIHTAAGVGFWMYSTDEFIKQARKYLSVEVHENAVQEVTSVRRQDLALRSAVDYLISEQSLGQRFLQNAGHFDNHLVSRAAELSKIAHDPLTARAVENIRALQDSYQPAFRRGFERFPSHDDYLASHLKKMSSVAEELHLHNRLAVPKSVIESAIQSAETMTGLSRAHAMLSDMKFWRNPLSGIPMSRDIDVEISPKRSTKPVAGATAEPVHVEVIEHETSEGEEPDVREEDHGDLTQPFELVESPRTIRFKSHAHQLRPPTTHEWNEWALAIERHRRYYSPAEIDEYNSGKDEVEEQAKEIWSPFYSEWRANEKLYNQVVVAVAGAQIDEHDEFPKDQSRKLPADLIEEIRFEIKSAAVTELYECYCRLDRSTGAEDPQRVIQSVDRDSTAFEIVHVMRRPTTTESKWFRTNIVQGYFSTNEEKQEVIELKLNLPIAIAAYDRFVLRIENATVNGQSFSDQSRQMFLDVINPIYKLRVVGALLNVHPWYFKVDDIVMP
jgi:hypothetical protein